MKTLFKLMYQNHLLREKDGAAGADGGGSDKGGNDNDLAAKLAALQAELEALKKGNNPEPKNPGIIDTAADEARKKAEHEEARQRMQSAIKFNLGLSEFLKNNKDYLTKLSSGIVETLAKKQFSDEEVQARMAQSALLEDFFSQQENVDAAPEELKPRIMAFKALTSDEKEKQAGKFWDVLTLTVGAKKMAAQVAAAKRANSGKYEETDDVIKNYNDRVFAMSKHYLGEKEQAK